ncbi:MAG TPA: 5'/3'-nucleotidase SurE [Candidatus Aquilonibacter sp.]|nr:5'/3'-nucleotidase SurE [Candidatus Aquilonibacter sp.]
MLVLVTNDDGVDSPGIVALSEALMTIGDVVVVAPDGDRSGIAHALSIHHPVRIRERKERRVKTYACSGTPADCVVVGAYELCGALPDLVVSGINRGANAGDDITYSGTIAAANEALLVGIPAIAVSLAVPWPVSDEEPQWDTAAQCTLDLIEQSAAFGLPDTTLLNLNVPNRHRSALRGLRWTKQARKRYTDRTDRRIDPRGETYVWIWGSYDGSVIDDDSDLAALRDGYASVTPITIDRTDEVMLERLRERSDNRV